MSLIMNSELSTFIASLESTPAPLTAARIEALLPSLTAAERPRSFRVLFWLLLRTIQADAELQEAIVEQWLPSEIDLAQLLEDVGKSGAPTVLSLDGVGHGMQRLWQLCDDVGLVHLVRSDDLEEIAALAPMAALDTERQLDELITAVGQDEPWKDPAEILSPHGDQEFELEALIALAQARMVQADSSEALHIVVLRLMNFADRVN